MHTSVAADAVLHATLSMEPKAAVALHDRWEDHAIGNKQTNFAYKLA